MGPLHPARRAQPLPRAQSLACPQHTSGPAAPGGRARSQGLCLPRCSPTSPLTPILTPSHLLLSFGAFPKRSFWRQPKRSLTQKVTSALNTATRGRTCCSQGRRWDRETVPQVPWPQLTSTVCDLEFAGLSPLLVALGGDHSCPERLHDFVEQLWSEAVLQGQQNPERGGSRQLCPTGAEAARAPRASPRRGGHPSPGVGNKKTEPQVLLGGQGAPLRSHQGGAEGPGCSPPPPTETMARPSGEGTWLDHLAKAQRPHPAHKRLPGARSQRRPTAKEQESPDGSQ